MHTIIYGDGICTIVFLMNWQIHPCTVLASNSLIKSIKRSFNLVKQQKNALKGVNKCLLLQNMGIYGKSVNIFGLFM